jgi:two-component system chemotaxis sensor kinase CheA
LTREREALLDRFRAGLKRRVHTARDLLTDPTDDAALPGRMQQALGEIHTLKGESSMLGLTGLAKLAHAVEGVLGASGAAELPAAARALAAMLDALDLPGASESDALLESALGELTPGTANARGSPKPELKTSPESSPETTFAASVGATDARPARPAQRWTQVDATLIDGLCECVAELSSTFGQLEASVHENAARGGVDSGRVLDGFEKCRALLDSATSTAWVLRLVPIEPMLRELAQHARTIGARQGKELDVRIFADGVQLERDVVDQLWDSLLHLVQNAVDHGIESASERGAKPTLARLLLSAESVGPSVILRVEDDGRGIDPERVRKSAIERGVADAETLRGASDKDIYDLLFEHGFSTKDETSVTSGRGVGLDVVKRRVESLGGNVELSTELGRGTRFSLSVPFAITKEKLLIVELESVPYGLPSRIVRAVLGAESLPARNAGDVARHNDEALPFRSLSLALGLGTAENESFGLVLELSGKRWAVGVARVVGERELIRRPAEPLLARTGIGASAVLEDGRVVLLPELNFLQRALRAASPGAQTPESTQRDTRSDRVLVVDDSPVVRDLVSEILSDAGLTVETAEDGAAAWEIIQRQEPDLLVSDVEMPRMTGLELLSHVRTRSQRLPVVLLTTRGSLEDRRKATTLGANAYLVKTDFQSDKLLDVVRRFVRLRV